ncbi:hypothetical protein Bca52824_082796 [Brassica carinata]|uniref:KIB1-4 beta-propeller domain-containing protein n=1 Tax=Brassica carinata TaxID=52824 RepID=A0A8X7TS95_BRACI|nr:hypothetical protein Bca52824_082796 [Brassica carinata]
MSSLLLSRLSKLSLRKQPALGRHLVGARFLSETPLCHIYGIEHCGYSRDDYGRPRYPEIGRLMITDFTGPSCWTKVLEKTVRMDLMTETGTMGASHGWAFTLRYGGIPHLLDDLNPGVSDSDGCEISLPDLVTLPHCQTKLVTNVAMSSSSPHDEDCILAIKFAGPQLSLIRPAQEKKEWVNIKIEDPSFFSSRVMYSKRDKKFAMPASEGTHIGYWDLGENLEKPKAQEFCDFFTPELLKSEWERLDSCVTSVELVESRTTDEMFMVKRFTERNGFNDGRMEERRIWVFRQDSSSTWCSTENIGDLCIFLSNAEPFCLKASSHQKCKNSIYFIDKSERGIFILGDKYKTSNFNKFTAPYFIPPQSYLDANLTLTSSLPLTLFHLNLTSMLIVAMDLILPKPCMTPTTSASIFMYSLLSFFAFAFTIWKWKF